MCAKSVQLKFVNEIALCELCFNYPDLFRDCLFDNEVGKCRVFNSDDFCKLVLVMQDVKDDHFWLLICVL